MRPQDDAEPATEALDRAAVAALLDKWRAAQNDGDFATYQSLYAEKMEGVKRVGARTWRFDRAGWMVDRGRMFKKPMTVEVSDVEMTGSARAPVVELVQAFRQGTFADQGPKRMVLSKTAKGLMIVREEMLTSEVVRKAMAVFLTLRVDGKPYVVISEERAPSWATGRPKGPFRVGDGSYYTLRDGSRAPGAAEWVDRKLAVYSAAGERCVATAGALRVVSGGTPYMDQHLVWQGEGGDPPATTAQMARDVYELGGHKLVAELAIEGACDPLFATAPDAKPVLYTALPSSDQLVGQAIAAFRKLPDYRVLQADFIDNYGGKGPWAPTPKTLAVAANGRKIVVVYAREGRGCGDFYGALTAVFEEVGGKVRSLLPNGLSFFAPSLVFDLQADGALELLGVPDDFSTVRALYSVEQADPLLRVEFPFNDCGC